MRVAGQSPTRVMSSEGSARRGAGRGAGRDGGRGGLRPGHGRGRGREAKGSRALPDRDAPDFATRLSKRMSHLLRHGAVEAGLGDAMDASGYVLVRDVLALPRFAGITEADVRQLVASCPKRRFELRGPVSALAGASGTTPRPSTAAPASSSSLSIRATQGHTMSSANTKLKDDLMLTRLDERAAAFVAEAAHGTTLRAWANIKTEGVKRMRRRHVHMARASHEGWSAFMTPNATETARGCSIECNGLADEGSSEAPRTDCVPSGAARGAAAETDGEALGVQRAGDGGGVVISGFRADARVAVWVDVARGVREGVPFFLSANGVVLSPGEGDTGAIPPRLFLRATDLKTGEALAL